MYPPDSSVQSDTVHLKGRQTIGCLTLAIRVIKYFKSDQMPSETSKDQFVLSELEFKIGAIGSEQWHIICRCKSSAICHMDSLKI